eukprot:1160087-Pelagomonas_calceolata.AAC.7
MWSVFTAYVVFLSYYLEKKDKTIRRICRRLRALMRQEAVTSAACSGYTGVAPTARDKQYLGPGYPFSLIDVGSAFTAFVPVARFSKACAQYSCKGSSGTLYRASSAHDIAISQKDWAKGNSWLTRERSKLLKERQALKDQGKTNQYWACICVNKKLRPDKSAHRTVGMPWDYKRPLARYPG